MARHVTWRKIESFGYRGTAHRWWRSGEFADILKQYRWEVSYAKYGMVNTNTTVKLLKLNDPNAKVTNLRKQSTVIAEFNTYNTYTAKSIIDDILSALMWMHYAVKNGNGLEFDFEAELLSLMRKFDIGKNVERSEWQKSDHYKDMIVTM